MLRRPSYLGLWMVPFFGAVSRVFTVLGFGLSAVASRRTINIAEITYADTYKAGFSPILATLGPLLPVRPTANVQFSPSAADLIDDVLAGGRKSGYTITYTPSPPDKTGHIKTYTVIARPVEYGKSGSNSYFTDESRVIRQTSDDRPATARDLTISP